MPRGRGVKLAVVGTAAGVFSGLFGVGGGTVIVPLLVLWVGYGERDASGTSLVAITGIAAIGAAAQGAYGRVDIDYGLLVGVPAVGGVLIGTWVQQRISTRLISALFAIMLVAAAVELLLP